MVSAAWLVVTGVVGVVIGLLSSFGLGRRMNNIHQQADTLNRCEGCSHHWSFHEKAGWTAPCGKCRFSDCRCQRYAGPMPQYGSRDTDSVESVDE